MAEEVDIVIIGAGVIGLAIAAQVADECREVYVLERHKSFGRETSSRNSQVIHSGIYYPTGSLKARLCIEGNTELYSTCLKYGIGYKKRGKLVVASDEYEIQKLEEILKTGVENGSEGLKLLSSGEINEIEANVKAVAALLVPSTGVIDAHRLMQHFQGVARERGARIVYQSDVVGVEKRGSNYTIGVKQPSEAYSFSTRVVINSAGLNCDHVAAMAGIDVINAGYKLHYCKGEYFKVRSGKSGMVQRLIYPVPQPRGVGLGIHATIDLEDRMLLGPNSIYIDEIEYSVDLEHKQDFHESAVKYLPFLKLDDLEPEMAGVRPALQSADTGFADFIIRDEADRGLPGFINLVGIDSPGLTSSPAIGRYVASIVNEALKG